MKIFGMQIGRRPETRANVEDPTVPVSASDFLQFFGVEGAGGAPVTLDRALTVPAFQAAVSFLSSSLASLPLHAYRYKDGKSERIGGMLQIMLNEAPNDEWSSFGARKWFWSQVFTRGRGIFLIERDGTGRNPVALLPVVPGDFSVSRKAGKRIYRVGGKQYSASDVIDVPFLLKADQVNVYSPLFLAKRALALSISMNDYASGFFSGGGVPPLAMTGPMPTGPEAIKRALEDMWRAIRAAKESGKPLFPLPPGYDLKQVGFDPEKGQMTDAQRFQVEEIARIFGLPPIFLQDLTRATFTNIEHQDLHLVKHTLSQWAKALEDELNLKLFGRSRNNRYVEHALDGMLRGDVVSRMNALTQAVQNALLTPNEGRAIDNRPPMPNGDNLMIQGATVPLGSQPVNGDGNEA